MNGLFGPDSGLMKVLTAISDIVLISMLWLICSLPVVTVGASTTAAYYTIMKVVHKKTGYISREFFKSFKLNFKDSLIITIVYELLMALLMYNIYTMYQAMGVDEPSSVTFYLLFTYCVLFLILLAVMIYTYPTLSRFVMKRFKIVRFAVYATFRHMLTTLLLLIVFIISFVALIVFPVCVIIMPGLCLYVYSIFMEKILRRYMSPEMLAQWDGPKDYMDEDADETVTRSSIRDIVASVNADTDIDTDGDTKDADDATEQ